MPTLNQPHICSSCGQYISLRAAANLIAHRIACPEGGYPPSEAHYLSVADYEAQTGMKYWPIDGEKP